MKKILSIFPMVYEAQPVFKKYGVESPKVGDKVNLIKNDIINLKGLVSGFGCARARERIKEAVSRTKPDIVILSGYCGSCRSGLKNGERMVDLQDNIKLLKPILENFGFEKMKIATVGNLADDKKKSELKETGYDAVEMEAAIVRDVIMELKVETEFVHLRWISDSADCKIPIDFFESLMNYETGEIKISLWNLIKSSIKRPRLIMELKKFGKDLIPAQAKYNSEIIKFYGEIEKRL